MITTRIEPPILNVPLDTVLTVDTKANMLEAASIWGLNSQELAQGRDCLCLMSGRMAKRTKRLCLMV